MMAKLEEGQTAGYWWARAEQYRKTLGGVNAANKRLKQRVKELEEENKKLKKLLREKEDTE